MGFGSLLGEGHSLGPPECVLVILVTESLHAEGVEDASEEVATGDGGWLLAVEVGDACAGVGGQPGGDVVVSSLHGRSSFFSFGGRH